MMDFPGVVAGPTTTRSPRSRRPAGRSPHRRARPRALGSRAERVPRGRGAQRPRMHDVRGGAREAAAGHVDHDPRGLGGAEPRGPPPAGARARPDELPPLHRRPRADHLLEDGHINDVIRKAVALGCPPADAVVMGTLNAARYHRLPRARRGRPRLRRRRRRRPRPRLVPPAERVWKRGRLVAEGGRAVDVPTVDRCPTGCGGASTCGELGAERLRDRRRTGRVRVIGVDARHDRHPGARRRTASRDGQAVRRPGAGPREDRR